MSKLSLILLLGQTTLLILPGPCHGQRHHPLLVPPYRECSGLGLLALGFHAGAACTEEEAGSTFTGGRRFFGGLSKSMVRPEAWERRRLKP